MTTAYFSHPDCLDHATPQGHPEQAARLGAIEAALSEMKGLQRHNAPVCANLDILRCHPEAYLERIQMAAPAKDEISLDPDTHMSPGTLTAAYRGVGANIAAVDRVLSRAASNAFIACRPPGHHAETARAMGFCLFGNVAIAAKHALEQHGLQRVAIIDFDVHHGNGTQDLLWDEARTLFCSSHQMPLFPGSGAASERGAHGNVVNVPLEPNSGSAEMRRAYEDQIFPAVENFAPEFILVSAGFDAHQADPLANLNWTTEDFIWITERICDLADAHCAGRLVSTLEGGYDLTALGQSVAAHVNVLMERGR
ncbi:MAG: histone deacetylase family protein [Marinosulfonomonas sp.]|nr:histone deacetylase family protein [Marinosulfonomonas sp.]